MKIWNLFTTRRFLPIFATQLLGAFNDSTLRNGIIVLITYDLVHTSSNSASILTAMAAAIFVLPFFIFSAFAGMLSDKYSKNKIIVFVKISEVILLAFAGIGFYFHNLAILFIVLFITGIHSAFFGPAKYSILPEHLSYKELLPANAIFEASTFASILFGTICGTWVGLGRLGILSVVVVMNVCAWIGLISSLSIPKTHSVATKLSISFNLFKQIKNTLAYSFTNKQVLNGILGISWVWLLGSIFLSQLPILFSQLFYVKPEVLSFMLCLFTIGMASGGIICNQILRGQISTKYVALGVAGISIFLFDFCYSVHCLLGAYSQFASVNFVQFFHNWYGVRVAIDLLLLSISGGFYVVPLYALIQYKSAPEFRSRVIASNNIINSIFMALASVIVFICLSLGAGLIGTFIIVAVLNLLVALWAHKVFKS